MDLLKKLTGDSKADPSADPVATDQDKKTDQSGSGGGLFDKVNNALGGGQKGEKEEDAVDKAVDWVQEHVLGQGQQTNESAVEQAKDEAISDVLRGQYKKVTGHDLPISDK